MRKALLVLVAFAAITFGSPANAHASSQPEIGVTGETRWPELVTVVDRLRETYGIPIRAAGCFVDQPCIYVSHYSQQDGRAGYAALRSGQTQEVEIALNDAYDRGNAHRMELLFHEFGHALGLHDHGPSCQSSMEAQVGMCGYYVVGYTAEQQAILREIWK